MDSAGSSPLELMSGSCGRLWWMPRVATADEVLLAANYKAQQKRAAEAQASLLGVPALPGLGYVGRAANAVQATVEMTFVDAYYTGGPEEVWALITNPEEIRALDLRHKTDNMDPGRAGLPRRPVLSNETPYAIVRTVE